MARTVRTEYRVQVRTERLPEQVERATAKVGPWTYEGKIGWHRVIGTNVRVQIFHYTDRRGNKKQANTFHVVR